MKPTASGEKADHVVKVGEEIDRSKETPISIISADVDTTSVTMVPTIAQEVERDSKNSKPAWTGHYVFSLLTTLCCFGPCSIIGLVHYLAAKAEYHKGNEREAMKRKRQASIWSWAALTIGLILTIAFITFFILFSRSYERKVNDEVSQFQDQLELAVRNEVDEKMEQSEARFSKLLGTRGKDGEERESAGRWHRKGKRGRSGRRGRKDYRKSQYPSSSTAFQEMTTSPFSRRRYGGSRSTPFMSYVFYSFPSSYSTTPEWDADRFDITGNSDSWADFGSTTASSTFADVQSSTTSWRPTDSTTSEPTTVSEVSSTAQWIADLERELALEELSTDEPEFTTPFEFTDEVEFTTPVEFTDEPEFSTTTETFGDEPESTTVNFESTGKFEEFTDEPEFSTTTETFGDEPESTTVNFESTGEFEEPTTSDAPITADIATDIIEDFTETFTSTSSSTSSTSTTTTAATVPSNTTSPSEFASETEFTTQSFEQTTAFEEPTTAFEEPSSTRGEIVDDSIVLSDLNLSEFRDNFTSSSTSSSSSSSSSTTTAATANLNSTSTDTQTPTVIVEEFALEIQPTTTGFAVEFVETPTDTAEEFGNVVLSEVTTDAEIDTTAAELTEKPVATDKPSPPAVSDIVIAVQPPKEEAKN